MKKYLQNTLIQSVVIGTTVWAIERFTVNNPPSLWWCIVAFIIAIIGVDFLKGQKVFNR